MKDLTKKLRELDVGLTNILFSTVFLFFLLLFFASLVYFSGFFAGLLWLMGATIGNIFFFWKNGVINPLNVGRISKYPDNEFHRRVEEYMRVACARYNPWQFTIFSYGIVLVPMLLSPNCTPLNRLPDVAVVGVFIYSILVVVQHMFMRALKARNPTKISEFFGVPEKEWRVDLMPAPRPLSITGVTLLFYGLAVFGFGLALALVVGKIIDVRILLPLELFTNIDIAIFSIGASILGSFCLATAHYLRKMRLEGAWAAILLCFMPIIMDVFAFVIFPLGTGRFPIPLYHAVWMIGVPLAVILIIKKYWRKFRRWT